MEETEQKSFAREIAKVKASSNKTTAKILDKQEAEDLVVEYISKSRIQEFDLDDGKVSKKTLTKKDLRKKKDAIKSLVTECLFSNVIKVRNYELSVFINEMVEEYGGYSILDEAFADEDISDIYCIAWNNIFVEKNGSNMKYWKTFKSPDHYNKIIERFLAADGKEINQGDKKIVDAELYGDRICATETAVTPVGRSITIRKHKEVQVTLDEMMEQHVMTDEMQELFSLIIDGECNMIYAGITGSGKTTTIRALLDYYVTKNKKRMVVCEETQELFPTNPHTMQMVSTKSSNEALSISLYDLIITGLRLKPKYIVVGEVRGVEAAAAIEAMETGHSTLFTMHGGTVWNNINRLVTKYIMQMPSLGTEVVERIIGAAVDYIAIQDDVPGWGRVVSTFDEISYDFEQRRIKVRNIFKFDQRKKEFVFLNRLSPEKADKMMRRGVAVERIDNWIQEGPISAPSDADKEYVKTINETYLREKEERHRKYAERKVTRKAEELKKKALNDVEVNTEMERFNMLDKLDELKMSMLIDETQEELTGEEIVETPEIIDIVEADEEI